jgi:hypothetical protein
MLTLHPSKGCVCNQIGSVWDLAETIGLGFVTLFLRFHLGPPLNRFMEGLEMPTDCTAIESQFRRLKGREARTESIATRFTRTEEKMLLQVAASQGENLREWAREVLLREARRAGGDPLFIELIATRMILLNLLKPLAMGLKVTPEDFTRISATVRSEKRKVAEQIQQQYTGSATKED